MQPEHSIRVLGGKHESAPGPADVCRTVYEAAHFFDERALSYSSAGTPFGPRHLPEVTALSSSRVVRKEKPLDPRKEDVAATTDSDMHCNVAYARPRTANNCVRRRTRCESAACLTELRREVFWRPRPCKISPCSAGDPRSGAVTYVWQRRTQRSWPQSTDQRGH